MISFPLHPLDALDAYVDALPDAGEGSRFHLCSDDAWGIREDRRRALAGDRTLLVEYDDGYDLSGIVRCTTRQAIGALTAWTQEDQKLVTR